MIEKWILILLIGQIILSSLNLYLAWKRLQIKKKPF